MKVWRRHHEPTQLVCRRLVARHSVVRHQLHSNQVCLWRKSPARCLSCDSRIACPEPCTPHRNRHRETLAQSAGPVACRRRRLEDPCCARKFRRNGLCISWTSRGVQYLHEKLLRQDLYPLHGTKVLCASAWTRDPQRRLHVRVRLELQTLLQRERCPWNQQHVFRRAHNPGRQACKLHAGLHDIRRPYPYW